MLTCKDASRLASIALDNHLSWRERWGLRMHLLLCKLCRRYVRELKFLREALRHGHERTEMARVIPIRSKLSSAARKRIRAAMVKNQEP